MVRNADEVLLATSDEPSDDALCDVARVHGMPVFRGSLDDVLGRYTKVAAFRNYDAVVRVSGDSPLLDPALVTRACDLFRDRQPDLASNVVVRSFPKGQSVEAIARRALEEADAETRSPHDREHVTPFFYARPDRFRMASFVSDSPRPELQLSVDTEADFRIVEAMIMAMDRPVDAYGVDELVALHDRVSADRQGRLA